MPTCVIDDNTEVWVVFVQSFDERKIFSPICLWAKFGYHFTKSKCTESTRLKIRVVDVSLCWPGTNGVPASYQVWLEWEDAFVQKEDLISCLHKLLNLSSKFFLKLA